MRDGKRVKHQPWLLAYWKSSSVYVYPPLLQPPECQNVLNRIFFAFGSTNIPSQIKSFIISSSFGLLQNSIQEKSPLLRVSRPESALLIRCCRQPVLGTNKHIVDALSILFYVRPIQLSDKKHALSAAWTCRIFGILDPAWVSAQLGAVLG